MGGASSCATKSEINLFVGFQLREMMQVADLNNDCVISAEEFAIAYGSLPWIRAQVSYCRRYVLGEPNMFIVQGVSGLMQRIMDIWKILDKNADGLEIPLCQIIAYVS